MGALNFVGKIKAYIKKNEKAILKSKKITKPELTDFKAILVSLSEGGYNFKTNNENLKKTLNKCYTRLITYRVNALCLRCAGKSERFFDPKTGNLKI